MGKPANRTALRRRWRTLRRCLPRLLLGLLTGCRAAAVPYTAEPGAIVPPRCVVITSQTVDDSVREATSRPLKTGWQLLVETADHLVAAGQGGIGKRLMALQGEPPPLADHPAPLNVAELEAELKEITGDEAEPAEMQLYVDGPAALEALDQALAEATSQIDVIMFHWDSDEVGWALAARLAARAGPNLRIRILVDGGGNLFFGEPEGACAATVNRVLCDLARHPYIEVVRIRNPFLRFDHRKLVLIDRRVAWTGGRNFTSDAFLRHHDVSVMMTGPLVARFQEHFEESWQEQTGQNPPAPANEGSGERPVHTAARPLPLEQANAWARLLVSAPGNRQLAQVLYEAVDRACQRIYLENVYFTDSKLLYKLMQARRRGVDVRVVLTVHSTTDTINHANRVAANRLLRAGVRVFLYPSMTHVKAVTVDGCWAYVGSGNFDPLSFRHNCEVGLSISASPIIAELEGRLFLPDFNPEWELTQPLALTPYDYLCEWVASFCL